MSTADTVKAQIQKLINEANEVTGNERTDLTTAHNDLIVGYGNGSGPDTSDATATADNIELDYTAYINGEKVTGNLKLVTDITFGEMDGTNGSDVAYRPSQESEDGEIIPAIIYIRVTNTEGKIIIDPNATLRIPTLASNLGDATPSDVRKGKTFSSASGVLLEGTNIDLPEVEEIWNE